ncbi:nuclear transport factor 2 family protein [Paracidobacterium acidisoli]|nr:nuclear transport factor 2 family protein [Paracidobacterium acidisoli]MBT9330131.1 nuclear transport factor 2 family protein [Paracidobacterium acidisoli]
MNDSKGPRRKKTVVCSCILMLAALLITASAQAEKAKSCSAPPPDKTYLQEIWSGWEKLDAGQQTKFYAQGPHVFFDESPLKYNSWAEFQAGVSGILTSIRSAKFRVNDDAEIHPGKEYVWATATVDQDALLSDDKHDIATFRWTVIFACEQNKWLIVHEHVSRPTQ